SRAAESRAAESRAPRDGDRRRQGECRLETRSEERRHGRAACQRRAAAREPDAGATIAARGPTALGAGRRIVERLGSRNFRRPTLIAATTGGSMTRNGVRRSRSKGWCAWPVLGVAIVAAACGPDQGGIVAPTTTGTTVGSGGGSSTTTSGSSTGGSGGAPTGAAGTGQAG